MGACDVYGGAAICAANDSRHPINLLAVDRRGAFSFDALRTLHTCRRTCHTNANPISRHFSAVDKSVFKGKHWQLCWLDGGRSTRKFTWSCNASVLVSTRAMNDENDAQHFILLQSTLRHSFIAISNIKSSQNYVASAPVSCLPLSQHSHTRTSTVDRRQYRAWMGLN